ncbi:MAG: hypothetical protein OXG80_01090 [Chloroflexi bacterium]|nr:hypothetical protein [Chloroflexota bacterium]
MTDCAGQRRQAAYQNVRTAGYRRWHAQQQHRGQAYRAERKPDESAQYANQAGYDGQQHRLP